MINNDSSTFQEYFYVYDYEVKKQGVPFIKSIKLKKKKKRKLNIVKNIIFTRL